jgi:hypothetical protein
MKLEDHIKPSEEFYQWEMFYIDVIRLIAHQVGCQKMTIEDIS